MASPVLVASSMTRHIPTPFHAMPQVSGHPRTLSAVSQIEDGDDGPGTVTSERSEWLPSRSDSKTPVLLHCPFDGCSRTFAKACKLEDHQRSHTGERPFRCTHPGCTKDFLRKDHLQRHTRSHRAADATTNAASDAARPFQCLFASAGAEACGRRFLTRQHLERHVREVHDLGSSSCDESLVAVSTAAVDTEGPPKARPRKRARRPGAYRCLVGDCTETFTKRKILRAHINVFHSDKGRTDLHELDAEEAAIVARLPFACSWDGCEKRFPTNAKRAAHVEQRHNQQMRYACTFDHGEEDAVLHFATWSELKAHHRIAHKPTCPTAGCGKEFKEARNLRLHIQRSHPDDVGALDEESGDDKVEDGALSFPSTEEASNSLWPCEWTQDGEPCTQSFSTKYNRDVHMRTVHKGERPFACPHSACSRRFTSKRASDRHGHKCAHAGKGSEEEAFAGDHEGDGEVDDDFYRQEGGAVPEFAADRPRARKRARGSSLDPPHLNAMDLLTGKAYATDGASKKRKIRGRVLGCPWSRICALRETTVSGEDENNGEGITLEACSFRFSRVYDVQRHLQRQHDLGLSQLDIRALLDDAERAHLGTPRSGTHIAIEAEQVSTDDEINEEQ